MKATGIVRRIDELGRIVIPKEIRKTLRIREGDPLEIFTDNEGGVILRKYSKIGEMGHFSDQCAKAMAQSTGYVSLITDRDEILATGGTKRKEIEGKRISRDLDNLISDREILIASKGDKRFIDVADDVREFNYEIIYPIISDSDVVGSIILLGKNGSAMESDAALKVASCGALFMGMHIE